MAQIGTHLWAVLPPQASSSSSSVKLHGPDEVRRRGEGVEGEGCQSSRPRNARLGVVSLAIRLAVAVARASSLDKAAVERLLCRAHWRPGGNLVGLFGLDCHALCVAKYLWMPRNGEVLVGGEPPLTLSSPVWTSVLLLTSTFSAARLKACSHQLNLNSAEPSSPTWGAEESPARRPSAARASTHGEHIRRISLTTRRSNLSLTFRASARPSSALPRPFPVSHMCT